METTTLLLFLFLGLIVGALAAWLISKFYFSSKQITPSELQERYVLKELWIAEKEEVARQIALVERKEIQLQQVMTDLGGAEQNVANLSEKLDSQHKEMEEAHLQMHHRFENLANKLLEEKAAKFSEHNQLQINQLLSPFKMQLEIFQKQVTEVYKSEARERFTLQGEIKSLVDLNQKISQEAKNLTEALKGDNKKQGNWGELILEKVLERSGLSKGQEYEVQYSTQNETGKRIQPDVVVHLPDGKHLILDAKVTLTAYERFVNSESESAQTSNLKAHLLSVRTHVAGLAEKNYASAKALDSPDFVMLFMPIESAFSAAIQADPELFNYAWDRKIVIVSPTTLLATLKTVASLWKQEKQTRHALDIARQAGSLYDKFVGFIDDMKKIESTLNQADRAYHAAMNKLQFGKGNLVGRAEKIRELGVKTSKRLPDTVLQNQLKE